MLLAALAGSLLLPRTEAGSASPIRLGLLRYGTAAWEIDVMRRHALDRRLGLDLVVTELAGGEAGKVALLAGSVDLIVADWVWALRQRAEGDDLACIPFSRAVGSLELPPTSAIRSPADLAGRRIGVAGGPLDKNWILLRALCRREAGFDPAEAAEPVFGAPPLLDREFEAGRLDALLTFWNFAARLESRGARPLLTVAEMLRRLGISADLPLLGYVFRVDWAQRNAAALESFAQASRQAKAIMLSSDEDWLQLAPLMQAAGAAELAALRDGYRAGIPTLWNEGQTAAAGQMFDILSGLGGEPLVGAARFDRAVFWDAGQAS